MSQNPSRSGLQFLLVFLVFVAGGLLGAELTAPKGKEQTSTALMWSEPTDIEDRDLFHGLGG